MSIMTETNPGGITVGIDIAKNIFAVHGVDENGKAVLIKPKVSREHLLPLIAQLPPCVIGIEACSGAHHWARLFREYGHTVKLMAPKFVTPYRMGGKRGKNDAADAAAICEAVTRAHMRFVPVKEEHQQIILCLHRTRQGFVEERTATYNRLRGLMSEFGIVLPQKVACLRRSIGAHLEDLPGYANQCIGDLLSHADQLDARVAEYDKAIAHAAREDARSKRLMERPGIGPVTASALLANIGGGHDFKNGRQVAAWVGLTPGQYSSGGKARLGRITKAGDGYLLVMGARSILAGLGDKQDGFSRFDPLFPDGISDETASALSEFLHQLAAACESRYFVQLRRYHRRQMNLYDPEAPWRAPPAEIP